MAALLEDPEIRADGDGPAPLLGFAQVSLPCRDLAEGTRFYVEVLGGEVRIATPTFASIRLAGVDIGIGTAVDVDALRCREWQLPN